MKNFIIALFFTCLLALAGQAEAGPLFSDNFADLSAWTIDGEASTVNHSTHPTPGNAPVAFLRAGNGDWSAIMKTGIPTVGFQDIVFSYYRHTELIGNFSSGDNFASRWRVQGDSEWTLLERLRTNDDWGFQSYALPDRAEDSLIDIRFFVRNEAGAAGHAYIDNAMVEGVRTGGVIPEPSTMLLLATGLLGAGLFRKRR